MGKDSSSPKLFYAISLAFQMGFLIAIPLVIFTVLGIFLDDNFDTFPLFLMVFVGIGLITTFFDVYYLVLPFLKKKTGRKE